MDGKVFGRGSQDMKSVGISYLEAIRRIRGQNFKRTIHLSFVPDEEIGGVEGMKAFVETEEFKRLNIGFALDEGVPSPLPKLFLFNGERAPWWIKIVATGTAGHGSALLQGCAVDRLLRVLERIQDFRAKQVHRLTTIGDEFVNSGKITSINITRLHAGKQINVIPDEAVAFVDVRVAQDCADDMLQIINGWTSVEGVSWSFEKRDDPVSPSDGHSEWLEALVAALNDAPFEMAIFPGATDSRFLRALGIPAIGFSPFINTPLLAHDHDEYLPVDQFLTGISIHARVIQNLADH